MNRRPAGHMLEATSAPRRLSNEEGDPIWPTACLVTKISLILRVNEYGKGASPQGLALVLFLQGAGTVLTQIAEPKQVALMLRFDGCDLTDTPIDKDDVSGYALSLCGCCGTPRHASLPYCCEFAGDAERTRELVRC